MGYRGWVRAHGTSLFTVLAIAGVGWGAPPEGALDPHRPQKRFLDGIEALYHDLGLSGDLDLDAFRQAMVGLYNLRRSGAITRQSPITIIDYGKPSSLERFFVIDLEARRLLFRTLVAHGVNSGVDPPQDFSNKVNSLKSSLGFFATLSTYIGRHGYSLKLRGLDPGFNDNAETRFIVIHGADYVSQRFLRLHGRLGHSWGCPALPTELAHRIIDTIREGSCLFIFANQEDYLLGSRHLDVASAALEFNRYDWDDRGPALETGRRDSADSDSRPVSPAAGRDR